MDEKKAKIDHVLVPSWKKWIKTNCLALTIYMVATGFILTVIYFTVIAQLQQKLAEINVKLAVIEKKNETKLQKTENSMVTNLDKYAMCYNGESWQRLNDYNRCVCAAGFFGKNCKHSDGKGTSFLVVFLGGLIGHIGKLKPKLLVASEITARLSVFYFNNTKNQSIIIDETNTETNLNTSVFPSDGIHSAGLEVHSVVRVNMNGFLYDGLHSEGFLLMPVRFASTKYIIPTLPYGYGKLLALKAVDQNTDISINLKLQYGSITYDNRQYGNNDTIRIVMNRYHTFQLTHTSDLSGTMVTSSKPVIVVSGNKCSWAVPNNHAGGCQSFIESVSPTNQQDNLFITPHVATRLNNTVRIQSINITNLTIKLGNEKKSRTIMARDSLDFYYNTISLIYASDDVLVMSYPHGLPKHKRDPFMMTIPGVNQYLNEYDFVVPTGFDSYISITVQSDAIGGFLLDGNPSNIRSVFSISEGLYKFSTFSMSISTGLHHIEHSRNVRFGLWINGNGDIDGYGYPAGMAYKIFD
ncbi:IgGFc-binding protein-like [Mytilus edulis]|uniref:IgGFc-binding protein N-terminal domain-containing protein n=1 Tax=Mytilus galloprovincialis TaxID=29158 RepID=A0A8B6EZM5_MYTGA|nr:Hypothetical predicted protein [Mytilus galloprovincialis]